MSVLTLYGALVTTQAPLPEVQLLLRQPDSGSSSSVGSFTPQDSALSWRQRDGASSPSHTPVMHSQRSSHTQSPHFLHTPREEDSSPPWLLNLCVSLVTQPREDQSDSEGAGTGGGAVLEPSPVRLEALQVSGWDRKQQQKKSSNRNFWNLWRWIFCASWIMMFQVLSHLVRGYFSLAQACLCEIGLVSARCLGETDPSIQLHGAKVKPSSSSYSIFKWFPHYSWFLCPLLFSLLSAPMFRLIQMV